MTPPPNDPSNAPTDAWREPDTLALLRCPVSGATLRPEQDGDGRWWLVAESDQALRYPVIDGVPRLVASAAANS